MVVQSQNVTTYRNVFRLFNLFLCHLIGKPTLIRMNEWFSVWYSSPMCMKEVQESSASKHFAYVKCNGLCSCMQIQFGTDLFHKLFVRETGIWTCRSFKWCLLELYHSLLNLSVDYRSYSNQSWGCTLLENHRKSTDTETALKANTSFLWSHTGSASKCASSKLGFDHHYFRLNMLVNAYTRVFKTSLPEKRD